MYYHRYQQYLSIALTAGLNPLVVLLPELNVGLSHSYLRAYERTWAESKGFYKVLLVGLVLSSLSV